MKKCLTVCLLVIAFGAQAQREYYYQLRIYHFKTDVQVQVLDHFLQAAFLPALHRAGIKTVGVFRPVETDTSDLRVYVFIPFRTIDGFLGLDAVLKKDASYITDGAGYLQAAYDAPPYTRMESILLKAFKDMPEPAVPGLSAPKRERVYELRSYESPTESYHQNKVHMFNEGGEVPLFKRLGFNAVFYSDVISGSHMPNLMYMTTFNNRADREQHWKTFNNDPVWKKLVSSPEYQHNVSKADITFLYPMDYSDL
jgi:hypothetical protein